MGEPVAAPPEEPVLELAARLDAAAQTRLGRSLALLHVPTGGCGGCESELSALDGAIYGLDRFGLRFVTSPRQADVLLATGPLSRNMRGALLQAYTAMPSPKWVVAIGDCAIDGGVLKGCYAVLDGIGGTLPVDLLVRGCPPAPADILTALLTLLAANAPPVPPRLRRRL